VQLKENIAAFQLTLPNNFMTLIDQIWQQFPMPY
jgi:aryl-alcohol dehydrogenase-like predicted oxidoreductase